VPDGGSGTQRGTWGVEWSKLAPITGRVSALQQQISTRPTYSLSIPCTTPDSLVPTTVPDGEGVIGVTVLHLRAWKLSVRMGKIGNCM